MIFIPSNVNVWGKKIKNCLLKCVYVLKLFASASDSTPAMSKCFCHHHKKQKFALIHLMISCLRWTCHPLLNPHFLFQLLMKVCILMDKYEISKYGFKFSCVESKCHIHCFMLDWRTIKAGSPTVLIKPNLFLCMKLFWF